MFEKFTEDAIKVITNSRQEARRLEFSYVMREHLFLGILHDRLGTCALVLSRLGIDLRKARRVIERLIGRGYSNTPLESVSFDLNVMETISNSVNVAESYGSKTVSAEHILLALVKGADQNFNRVFEDLNIEAEDIETEIKVLWQSEERLSVSSGTDHEFPEYYSPKFLSPLAKAVMEDACSETVKQKHTFIATEQVLLSLSKKQSGSLSSKLLSRYGLDENSIRVEIHRIIGTGSGTNHDLLENTTVVEKSLEYAWREARRFRYGKIGTGHLLAGILTMDTCTATTMLKLLNIDPEQLKWETMHILKKYPENPEPSLTPEQLEKELHPELLNDEMAEQLPEKDTDLNEENDF